jgi:hypothetical protein
MQIACMCGWLARLFAQSRKSEDAQQQVALAFAEARVNDPDVVTADDYLNAADILLSVNQFALAQRLFTRAEGLGADPLTVATGMANASLALGDTRGAEALLTSAQVEDPAEKQQNYPYLVAMGNAHGGVEPPRPIVFARASADPAVPLGMRRPNWRKKKAANSPKRCCRIAVQIAPVFEDENIYQLDAG